MLRLILEIQFFFYYTRTLVNFIYKYMESFAYIVNYSINLMIVRTVCVVYPNFLFSFLYTFLM